MFDPFSRRWVLIHQVHTIAQPGVLKDLKWISRSSLSNSDAKMNKKHFIATFLKLCGISPFEKANSALRELLGELFILGQRQETPEGKVSKVVDIRFTLISLYLVENVSKYQISEQLHQVFDILHYFENNELTFEVFGRMLLSFAASTQWAIKIIKTLLDCAIDQQACVKWETIKELFETSRYDDVNSVFGTLDQAFQACFSNEDRLYLKNEETRLELEMAQSQSEKIFMKSLLCKWKFKRIRHAFLIWSEYSKIKELKTKEGARHFRRKYLQIGMNKLRHFSKKSRHNYSQYVKSSLFYRVLLLKRTFQKLHSHHAYHSTLKRYRFIAYKDQIAKGLERLCNIQNCIVKRRNREQIELRWWSWQRIHVIWRAKYTRAVYFHIAHLMHPVFKIWHSHTLEAIRNRQQERHRRINVGSLSDQLFEAREEFIKKQIAQELDDADQERQNNKNKRLEQKYQHRFALVEEKQKRKHRRDAVVLKQHDMCQKRKIQEKQNIEDQIKSLRNERLEEIRRERFIYFTETKPGKLLCKKSVEEIQKAIKRSPHMELTQLQVRALDKFGGRVDYGSSVTELLKLREEVTQESGYVPQHSVRLVNRNNQPFNMDVKVTNEFVIERVILWQLIEQEVAVVVAQVDDECNVALDALKTNYAANVIQRVIIRHVRRKRFSGEMARARLERSHSSALKIQCRWRIYCSLTQCDHVLQQIVYLKTDPVSKMEFCFNSLNGTSSWGTLTLIKKHPWMKTHINHRMWFLLFDSVEYNQYYYQHVETGEMLWRSPGGLRMCDICSVDFADKICLQDRFVQEGQVFNPHYCIVCWTNGGHNHHSSTNLL